MAKAISNAFQRLLEEIIKSSSLTRDGKYIRYPLLGPTAQARNVVDIFLEPTFLGIMSRAWESTRSGASF